MQNSAVQCREGAPHQETRNCQSENKNLVMGSRWEPDTKINLVYMGEASSKKPTFRLINATEKCCLFSFPELLAIKAISLKVLLDIIS
jgi:hypothetical protein